MPDIFLYSGEPNPNDIRLSDPTVVRGGGGGSTYLASFAALSTSFVTLTPAAVRAASFAAPATSVVTFTPAAVRSAAFTALATSTVTLGTTRLRTAAFLAPATSVVTFAPAATHVAAFTALATSTVTLTGQRVGETPPAPEPARETGGLLAASLRSPYIRLRQGRFGARARGRCSMSAARVQSRGLTAAASSSATFTPQRRRAFGAFELAAILELAE